MSNESKYSHHAHILPLKLYLLIGGGLIFLTLVTVAVAQVHLGPFNLVVALLIAVLKASLVGLFFMHMFWDNKLYALFFTAGIAFLGLFITITMFDTMRRGDIYQEVGQPIKPDAVTYKTAGQPIKETGHGEGEHKAVEGEK